MMNVSISKILIIKGPALAGGIVLGLGAAVIAGILLLAALRRRHRGTAPVPGYPILLEEQVGFYRALAPADRPGFVARIEAFLRYVRVHSVQTPLEDLDKVLVAASAVIPTFGFPDWTYHNLTDVLLYESAFDAQHFAGPDNRHNVLGMVGTGAMERVMILSKPALRAGYAEVQGAANTGIHEFVHLVNKADGAVDGVPESLLGPYAEAWSHLVHTYLGPVGAGHTDILPYGGTNPAEFLAVTSEYFFKRPDLLEERHPDLYSLLSHLFQQRPRVDPRVITPDT
jgi:MtfA peptidase